MNQESPSREAIAERACCFWEQAGRLAGRDEKFWLRAEAEPLLQANRAGEPPMATAPPIPAASSMHQVPPHIEGAMQSPGRHPLRPRGPKRA
jgi:hypothetical protein